MQVSRSSEQLVHLCALCEHSCFLRCVSIGTANDEFGGHMQTVPRRCPQTLSEQKRALEFGNALGVRGNRRFPQEQVSRSRTLAPGRSYCMGAR